MDPKETPLLEGGEHLSSLFTANFSATHVPRPE